MSGSIFSAAAAFSGLTKVFNTLSSVIEMAGPSMAKKGAMYLDPGDAIIGLAILAIYRKTGECGIKVSLVDYRIWRDHATYSRPVQAFKRTFQGTTHGQLSDLTVALFYAAKWFKPLETTKFQVIFKLAREGILALIETYRKEGKQHIVQYLSAAHLRIIDLALRGGELVNEEFEIPIWEGKPLAMYSLRMWAHDGFERLAAINELFTSALIPGTLELREAYPIEPLITLVKARIDEAVQPILSYKDTLASSIGEEVASAAASSLDTRDKDHEEQIEDEAPSLEWVLKRK